MADSLDDFFAKKDKKRGKNKGTAVLSSEVLQRELEEGAKQVEYSSRKENKTSAAIEILGLGADDADWRDFDEVDRRDYTGLKVKEMSLQDQADAEQRRPSADQTDGAPEISPWAKKEEQPASSTSTTNDSNKTSAGQDSTKTDSDQAVSGADGKSDPVSSSKLGPVDKDENVKKTGDKVSAKYQPPGSRGMQNLAPVILGKSKGLSRGNDKKVDIQDKQAFPSLG